MLDVFLTFLAKQASIIRQRVSRESVIRTLVARNFLKEMTIENPCA